MSFRSPWSAPPYVAAVERARRSLREAGRPEEPFIRRLVTTQNRRVRRYLAGRRARSVLLILPRCVKQPGCPLDSRGDLSVCADCRLCPLGEVARLTARRGVRALVAFRSHVAYAMARREGPDVIVAVACEDRLVKALRHVPDIPALLAPLAGTTGTCAGAEFDLAGLTATVDSVLGPPATDRAALG